MFNRHFLWQPALTACDYEHGDLFYCAGPTQETALVKTDFKKVWTGFAATTKNDGEWTNRVLTKFVHTVTVKQCFVFLLRVYGSKKTLYNSGHVTLLFMHIQCQFNH